MYFPSLATTKEESLSPIRARQISWLLAKIHRTRRVKYQSCFPPASALAEHAKYLDSSLIYIEAKGKIFGAFPCRCWEIGRNLLYSARNSIFLVSWPPNIKTSTYRVREKADWCPGKENKGQIYTIGSKVLWAWHRKCEDLQEKALITRNFLWDKVVSKWDEEK